MLPHTFGPEKARDEVRTAGCGIEESIVVSGNYVSYLEIYDCFGDMFLKLYADFSENAERQKQYNSLSR